MNAPANLTDATFRARHVGASEVSALFDSNPWLTHFELWHRKQGNIATPEFNAVADDGTPENERIYWGVRLEAAIIEAAQERYGYVDRPPADSAADQRQGPWWPSRPARDLPRTRARHHRNQDGRLAGAQILGR